MTTADTSSDNGKITYLKPRTNVRRLPVWWGVIYTGTKSALIAEGIVRAEWFPGEPGNNKVSQRIVFENGRPRLLLGQGSVSGQRCAARIEIRLRRRRASGEHLYSVRKTNEVLEFEHGIEQPAQILAYSSSPSTGLDATRSELIRCASPATPEFDAPVMARCIAALVARQSYLRLPFGEKAKILASLYVLSAAGMVSPEACASRLP